MYSRRRPCGGLGGGGIDAGMPEGDAKVDFERGAAFDDSTQPHPAVRALKPALPDRSFVLVLIVGILIGTVLSAILGIGLYAYGWLDFGAGSPPPTSPALCPPTAAFLPACPTCAAACLSTMALSATPSPENTPVPATATPDFAATATQACTVFRNRFPGTPCPRLPTPTPGP
jgi:hypothetical protein